MIVLFICLWYMVILMKSFHKYLYIIYVYVVNYKNYEYTYILVVHIQFQQLHQQQSKGQKTIKLAICYLNHYNITRKWCGIRQKKKIARDNFYKKKLKNTWITIIWKMKQICIIICKLKIKTSIRWPFTVLQWRPLRRWPCLSLSLSISFHLFRKAQIPQQAE